MFLKKYTKNIHQKWKYYREQKQDFERFLIFLNIKMSAKSNKIELSEEFIAMWKEDQPPGVFCKKGVLRNFAKFTGKHLCQSLFFNKVAGLAKFLRTPPSDCFQSLKRMSDKFQFFSNWFFQIKLCFKCKTLFSAYPGHCVYVFQLAWQWNSI